MCGWVKTAKKMRSVEWMESRIKSKEIILDETECWKEYTILEILE